MSEYIVGCGRIALGAHLPILRRMREVEVCAVAEPDCVRLEQALRQAPHATPFHSIEEMLAGGRLDAVVVCLPNALHASAAIAALESRAHLYLEKPLAVTLQESCAVVRAWRKAAVTGMIGFNYRFNRLYESARDCVRSGRLGDVVAVRSVFSLAPHEQPERKASLRNGGGVLFDLASHHIDLMHHFFGQPVRWVSARPAAGDGSWESATLDLVMANGVLVQSFFSLAATEDDRLEIYGRCGKLTVDRHLSLDIQVTGPTHHSARLQQLQNLIRGAAHLTYLLEKRRSPAFEPSYGAALRAFIESIRSGHPASPDLLDGYRSMAVIHAALESSETGRWTEVPAYEDIAAE